jgi:hypothetical protein
MLNPVTQRYITHVILADKESVAELQVLAQNAEELCKEFCRVFRATSCFCYGVVLAFPQGRADLNSVAGGIQLRMQALGAQCTLSNIAETDRKGRPSCLHPLGARRRGATQR